MAKYRIYTVGLALPGDEFEFIDFDSDVTLLDADIILFQPGLGPTESYESWKGKTLLNERSSFRVKERLDHWRNEIFAAVKAGRVVVVFLVKPEDCYRYTGETEYSGTGRSRVTQNIVAPISSYDAVPNLKAVTPKSGTEIELDKDAKFLAAYWKEFAEYSPYEVEIEGEFRVTLRARSSTRAVGGAVKSSGGALLFLPRLNFDEASFTRVGKTGDEFWNDKGLRFGKQLLSALVGIADGLAGPNESTPPPAWTGEQKYRLESESRFEAEISQIANNISNLQTKKANAEDSLRKAGSLRRLLFEQGKPLEAAVVEALRLFGFQAEPFQDGESEFDAVFVSAEGRCLGEAEGKDNKAINIDKFSQLERNLQEDFARDSVSEYAKGRPVWERISTYIFE